MTGETTWASMKKSLAEWPIAKKTFLKSYATVISSGQGLSLCYVFEQCLGKWDPDSWLGLVDATIMQIINNNGCAESKESSFHLQNSIQSLAQGNSSKRLTVWLIWTASTLENSSLSCCEEFSSYLEENKSLKCGVSSLPLWLRKLSQGNIYQVFFVSFSQQSPNQIYVLSHLWCMEVLEHLCWWRLLMFP